MGQETSTEKPNILSVLRSKTILVRMTVVAGCFICCSFVFSGAIIHSTNISGNKYLNYSMMVLLGVPTRIITAFTLTRIGRKIPICVAYCLCSMFFMSAAFVPKSIGWASTFLYMAGKMCSSYGIFSMSVVAIEIFPTTSRNSLTNMANTVGRIGSVLAPQTPLLADNLTGAFDETLNIEYQHRHSWYCCAINFYSPLILLLHSFQVLVCTMYFYTSLHRLESLAKICDWDENSGRYPGRQYVGKPTKQRITWSDWKEWLRRNLSAANL